VRASCFKCNGRALSSVAVALSLRFGRNKRRLCDANAPGGYLLLDGRTRKTTMYLPARNPRLEAAEGRVLSADGDLVLMDYAPDYRYYTSDIGRVWPVNGRYAPWQRELLQFVLDFHKAVLQRIRPGVTAEQIHEEAKKAMEPVFARTRSPNQSTSRPPGAWSRQAAAFSRTRWGWRCTMLVATAGRR
jgi:peptidase M24-like protein